jgi:hypothetical protein
MTEPPLPPLLGNNADEIAHQADLAKLAKIEKWALSSRSANHGARAGCGT